MASNNKRLKQRIKRLQKYVAKLENELEKSTNESVEFLTSNVTAATRESLVKEFRNYLVFGVTLLSVGGYWTIGTVVRQVVELRGEEIENELDQRIESAERRVDSLTPMFVQNATNLELQRLEIERQAQEITAGFVRKKDLLETIGEDLRQLELRKKEFAKKFVNVQPVNFDVSTVQTYFEIPIDFPEHLLMRVGKEAIVSKFSLTSIEKDIQDPGWLVTYQNQTYDVEFIFDDMLDYCAWYAKVTDRATKKTIDLSGPSGDPHGDMLTLTECNFTGEGCEISFDLLN